MTDMPTNWCPLESGCAYACSGRLGCEAWTSEPLLSEEVRAPRRSIVDCGLLLGTVGIVLVELTFVVAPFFV